MLGDLAAESKWDCKHGSEAVIIHRPGYTAYWLSKSNHEFVSSVFLRLEVVLHFLYTGLTQRLQVCIGLMVWYRFSIVALFTYKTFHVLYIIMAISKRMWCNSTDKSIGVNFAKVVSFTGKNTRLCYETIYVATLRKFLYNFLFNFHVSFHKILSFLCIWKIGKALKKSSPKTDLPLDECNERRFINCWKYHLSRCWLGKYSIRSPDEQCKEGRHLGKL